MQKKILNKYSKLSTPLFSKGRMFKEKKNKFRNPYQRDRDRIIHSTAFRRLKHKTQVFVNTSSDHYRTRITHSLEVSQIARTIAKYFGLNEDLCETLSLSHDLGHTPFGHAGEETLNDCMQDYGGFDHNIQTVRIVSILETKHYSFCGLNLSIETLDGLIKHNGPVYNLKKFESIIGKNYFKGKINFFNQASLESQIASISDDIAYNSHDLEDGLNAKLFELEDLYSIPVISDLIKYNKKIIYNNNRVLLREIIREIINEMVKDVIKSTKINLKKLKIKNINDIFKSEKGIVNFSPQMSKFDLAIKDFLKEKMYNNKNVIKKTNHGKKVLKTLFFHIKNNPKKYINKKIEKKDKIERSVCDFIAGMTDRYAIKLYKSIK